MPSGLAEIPAVTNRRYKVLAAIMLGGIMGPIDASIVNVILPTITGFFDTPIATAQWVPLIYLLAALFSFMQAEHAQKPVKSGALAN